MVQSLFLPGLCGDTVGRCSQCEARVQSDQDGYGQVFIGAPSTQDDPEREVAAAG